MTNYFDFDDRPWNDDTCDREQERSRFSLKDATEYDEKLFNKILNKDTLTDADKYNLASILTWYTAELMNHMETTKSFEEFTIEVNGKEWFDNMARAWLRRKSVEMAKNWGCPELANTKGVYFVDGEDADI